MSDCDNASSQPFPVQEHDNSTSIDEFPLSNIQKSLLRDHSLLTKRAGCNLRTNLYFTGTVDFSKLQLAFSTLIHRHGALRTKIVRRADPVEELAQETASPTSIAYLCYHTNRDFLDGSLQHRFALTDQWPIRLHYFTSRPGKHLIAIVASWLACDRTSMRRITAELWELYEAYLDHRRPQLGPAGVQYSEYVSWESQCADSLTFEEIMKSEGPGRPSRGHSLWTGEAGTMDAGIIRINPYLHKQLQKVAEKHGASMETIAVAAIGMLIASIDGTGQMLLAVDGAVRDNPWLQTAVGCYDSIFPFVISIPHSATIVDLAAELREALAKRNPLRPAPANVLDTCREALPNASLSVLVLWREKKEEAIFRRKEVTLEPGACSLCGWRFDIAVEFAEQKDERGNLSGIVVRWEYDQNRISYSGFIRLMKEFEDILISRIAGQSDKMHRAPIAADALNSMSSPAGDVMPNRLLQYAAANNPTQDRIIEIWESILKISGISVFDRFDHLGGDARQLEKMLDIACNRFGRNVEPRSIAASPSITVSKLARLFVEGFVREQAQRIEPPGDPEMPPLLFLHGDMDGGGLYLSEMATLLSTKQSLVALHPHGIIDKNVPASVEEMAAGYVEEILRIGFKGPFCVAGYCNAGLVAFEMARRLKGSGFDVALVALIGSLYKPGGGTAPENGRAQNGRRGGRSADLTPFDRHMRAAQEFIPQYYGGVVTTLWPEEDPSIEPLEVHWGRVADSVESYSISGNHRSCISGRLRSLAECLNRCISKAMIRQEVAE